MTEMSEVTEVPEMVAKIRVPVTIVRGIPIAIVRNVRPIPPVRKFKCRALARDVNAVQPRKACARTA